jgi:O-antigen ligase
LIPVAPSTLDSDARSRYLERGLTALAIVLVSLGTAASSAGSAGRPSKPLLAVLVLTGAAVMLKVAAEQLLLGWLFLAPLLQESASSNHVGHVLALSLYTAPPIVFLLTAVMTRGSRPARKWFDLLPVLYAAFVFASLALTASGELRSGTVGTLRGFYQTVLIGIIVYYVVGFWPGRGLSVVRISRLVLAAAALQALMVVIEWATGWNLWHDTTWQQTGDVRSIGTLANPALTGAFIGVGIVVALSVLCWQGPSVLDRLATAMILVGVPGLYATKTRGPILATVIVAILCVLLARRSRLLAVGVLLAAVLGLLMFWPQIKGSSVYQNRIDQKSNVDARLVLQQISIRLLEQKPILGWGYNSFDRAKYRVSINSASVPVRDALQSTSHDTFLTTLVEFGLVGFALFVLPWVVILRRALRRVRTPSPDRWFYVAGISSILVIVINGVTLDYRFFSFVPMLAWFFLGLLRREDATGAELPVAH